MEKVGIVILNYLNYQDTIDCIDSLNIDLYNNKEIIIVDNYSKNESYNILNDLYKNNKHIHVIKNDCNSGFAKGNNIGIEYAKNVLDCSHVLLLNSDTVIKCNDFIKSFVESYESGVGIIGCRIVTLEGIEQNPHRLNIHKNDIVDKLYKLKNDKLSIREKAYSIKSYKILEEFILRRSRIKRNKDKVKNNISSLDLVLHGACMMLTKDYFEYYPYLYPETFLYCEEDILTILTRKVGLKKLFINNIFIEHKEGQSSKASFKDKNSIKAKYYLESYNKCYELFDMKYEDICDKYFTNKREVSI